MSTRPSYLPILFLPLATLLAVAPAQGAPALVLLPWSAHGATSQARFGAVVAPAGDVNGDGYTDVLVSAPKDEAPATDAGKVFLYLGTAQGLAASPAWSWSANQAGGASGAAAAAAGDVNGDGYGDVVIGTPQWNVGGTTQAGKISVFHGGPNGLPASPTYERTAPTPTAGARFGFAVATAGDVNGDTYDDVIVGAPFHSAGGLTGRGAAFVFHGGASGLAATPALTLLGADAGANLGKAVSTAGDVDADGYADVIVGAPHAMFGGTTCGTASLFRGSSGGVLAVADTVLGGEQGLEEVGAAVANAGDVDGDGYADVLVGHPGYSNGGLNTGGYELVRGGPGGMQSPALVSDFSLASQGQRRGAALATLGDLNGDGYADFAVGEPSDSSLAPDPRVYVYLGGPLPLGPRTELLSSSGQAAYFGSSIATAGDIDGNGLAEFLVGDPGASVVPGAAEGTAALYQLARSVPAIMPGGAIFSGEPGTLRGAAVAIAPGFDVSGYPRLLVGEPGYDIGTADWGLLNIYHDGPDGVVLGPFDAQFGQAAGDRFSAVLAEVGDIDRDGYTDALVSSPTHNAAGGSEAGLVSLVRGAQPTPANAVSLLEGDQSLEHLGTAIAGRGDVDGDGYHDVLIGAPEWDGPGLPDCGKVWLFFGGPTGFRAQAWTAEGTVAGQGLGASLAIGDLDGDGFGDVILGSVSPLSVSPPAGQVEVHYGSATGPASAAAWTVASPVPASPSFGTALAAVGDVDGDGVSDLVVGAPGEDGMGRVYVYPGTRGRGVPSPYVYVGTQAGARFGATVSGGGDVDGDGIGDFVVGEPGYDGGQTDEGRLHLFYGNHGKPGEAWTAESDGAGLGLGSSLARLIDLNDDGFADIAAGAPATTGVAGGAFVFLGGGGVSRRRCLPIEKDLSANPFLYYPVRIAADQTIAVSFPLESPEGRARVSFQLETTLLDQPFTGQPTQVYGPYDAGPGGSGVFAQLTLPWEGSAYKVRGRSRSRSPFFPGSRWVRSEAHAEGEFDVLRGGTSVAVDPDGRPALTVPRLAGISPNPLAASAGAATARIAYELPRAARVTLDLYDVRGARVRGLVDGPRPAGASSATWDGRDAQGRPAPAGLYFVRLVADGHVERGRLVRLP